MKQRAVKAEAKTPPKGLPVRNKDKQHRPQKCWCGDSDLEDLIYYLRRVSDDFQDRTSWINPDKYIELDDAVQTLTRVNAKFESLLKQVKKFGRAAKVDKRTEEEADFLTEQLYGVLNRLRDFSDEFEQIKIVGNQLVDAFEGFNGGIDDHLKELRSINRDWKKLNLR
jgi:hypothetical protein